MERLGKRLRELRKEKDMSATQLAKASGLRIETISRLETGLIKNPAIDTLKKIAAALGVKVWSLLTAEKLVTANPDSENSHVTFLVPKEILEKDGELLIKLKREEKDSKIKE